jgi:DtxR family Mn-dependent transcriptional regulator
MIGGAMEKERIEEMLELLWTLKEAGNDELNTVLEKSGDEDAREVIDVLKKERLLASREGKVVLTDDGEKKAREIVRRNRLAEALLAQVLELEDNEVMDSACKFEHVLSPKVTESICTFLGHPPVCPHGKPIPRGECCLRADTEIKPFVTRLTDVEVGADVSTVFITPMLHATLDRLAGFGIVPGSKMRLHQKRPSYVVQIGETTVALDEEIARGIYVKIV